MGIFDFLKRSRMGKEDVVADVKPISELSKVEKELMLVKRVTESDMIQFSMIPYDLRGPIRKHIQAGSHPFAYMDLSKENQISARYSIEELNSFIEQVSVVPKEIRIDFNKIIFKSADKNYGYSKLICTPYTPSGKISKYPVSLLFMSNPAIGNESQIGNIYYGKDGSILKANAHIHTRTASWSFVWKTMGRTLVLFSVCTNAYSKSKDILETIYTFNP